MKKSRRVKERLTLDRTKEASCKKLFSSRFYMRIIRLVTALVILDTVFSSSSSERTDLELQIDGFNPFTIVIETITLSLTFCYKHKKQKNSSGMFVKSVVLCGQTRSSLLRLIRAKYICIVFFLLINVSAAPRNPF